MPASSTQSCTYNLSSCKTHCIAVLGFIRNGDSRFRHGFTRISRLIRKPESIYAVSNVFEWRHIFVGFVERLSRICRQRTKSDNMMDMTEKINDR